MLGRRARAAQNEQRSTEVPDARVSVFVMEDKEEEEAEEVARVLITLYRLWALI